MIDESSAELIALLGDGSFRDTQGILQKVLSYGKGPEGSHGRKRPASDGAGKISEEEVRLVTGAPAIDLVHDVVLAIGSKDVKLGLETVKKVARENIDMMVFLKLILHTTRAVMLVRFNAGDIVKEDLSLNEFAFVADLGKKFPETFSSQTLLELLTAYENTRGAYIPSLPLELALVNITQK